MIFPYRYPWIFTALAVALILFSGCAQVTNSPPSSSSGCLQESIADENAEDGQLKDTAIGLSSNEEQTIEGQSAYQEPAASPSRDAEPKGLAGDPQAEPVQLLNPMDAASHLNFQIHDLAVQLLENFSGELLPEYPIAVATFVDLNDLYRTSPYGRYIAEQLMGELQRAGFQVVELRRTDSILIKERYGEYGLSRQVREIARDSKAHYVLVGTYVTRGGYVFTNARLISATSNMVASSALKIMKRDHLLDRMLWPSAAPVRRRKAVKVPIKEWGELTEVRVLTGS